MKKLSWIIVAIIIILVLDFAAIYKTRLKHYILPTGTAPERPQDGGFQR